MKDPFDDLTPEEYFKLAYELNIDPTAGYVETPGGIGRFVKYDSTKGTVTVEMDNRYLVEYPAYKCYPILNLNKEG